MVQLRALFKEVNGCLNELLILRPFIYFIHEKVFCLLILLFKWNIFIFYDNQNLKKCIWASNDKYWLIDFIIFYTWCGCKFIKYKYYSFLFIFFLWHNSHTFMRWLLCSPSTPKFVIQTRVLYYRKHNYYVQCVQYTHIGTIRVTPSRPLSALWINNNHNNCFISLIIIPTQARRNISRVLKMFRWYSVYFYRR